MDYIEEQKDELEALSEIYFNEIQDPSVRSNEPPISFSIHVRPQASSYEEAEVIDEDDDLDSDDEAEEAVDKPVPPSVELLFELPENYPDAKPSIQALDFTNLEKNEVVSLLSNIDKKAEEYLGSVMISMLVSDIVEWLSSIAEKEEEEIQQEATRKIEVLEAEERRKAEGTSVTMETFLAWKAKFDAELLKAKIEQQKKQTEQNPSGLKRLTGREMFETDKALAESDLNFVDDLEQEQIEALMQNIDEIELNDEGGDFVLGYEDDDDDDDDDLSGQELSDSDE